MTYRISRTSLGDLSIKAPCNDVRLVQREEFEGSGEISGWEWYINLDTPEELVDFLKGFRAVVLKLNEKVPEIEIYDQYRE